MAPTTVLIEDTCPFRLQKKFDGSACRTTSVGQEWNSLPGLQDQFNEAADWVAQSLKLRGWSSDRFSQPWS